MLAIGRVYDSPMRPQIESLDALDRACEKQASRDLDAQALASGEESADELKQQNEVFLPLLASARINLTASQRLA